MCFKLGQGIFGKIRFRDGDFPVYGRPYLIITVATDYIEVLNVSSSRGKERKLAFPTNEALRVYKPPFILPSFVKLDSLTRIDASDWGSFTLLMHGATLDATELERIQKLVIR